MLNVPAVFIDLTPEDQAVELLVYFKSLGADVSEDKSPKGIEDDLNQIINVCETCFKANEAEVESVLNAIVSMLVVIPVNRAEQLILSFSKKLTKAKGQKLGQIALRVLWLLFQSLDEHCPIRYYVYYHLIQIAKQVEQVRAVFRGVDHLKQQFVSSPPTTEQMQKLLRLLHQVLVASKESELAAKVMIELLSTYTTENASQAREDAQRCIVAALGDPETFLLDPLLSLKPVRILEGELIHQLLTIFVSEKLTDYIKFYQNNKELIEVELGLDHERNLKKMRLLTFMQLAEGATEMSFSTITSELQIEEEEVEAFIIEVLKTKLVRARMDQAAKKVYIASTMHRTFGRPQWQQLRDTLHAWKSNLANVQEGMKAVVSAQMELAQQIQ